MTIYGPGIGTLWRTIESYGLNPRLVISEEVYTPGDHGTGKARIPYETFSKMRANAAQLIDDPALGIRSAQHVHPSHMGPLGHAWLASSTLLDAFRRIERYGRMFNESEHLVISEDPDQFVMTIHVPQVSYVNEVRDAIAAGLVTLCRFNWGPDLNPDRVRMTRPMPRDPAPWFAYFRCPVDFACEADQLVFSRAKALKPLSSADPELTAIHDEAIERYLGNLDRSDIVSRARIEILDQLASGQVTEDSVANALNMTKRTLHRRLSEEGLTFRRLIDEVRKDLVRRHLEDPHLTLTDIAFLLGFGDASSFSRAFKRWFGTSPSRVRAGQST